MNISEAMTLLKMKPNRNGGFYSPGLEISYEKKILLLKFHSLGNGIRKSAKMAKVSFSTAHKIINSKNLLNKKRGKKKFEPDAIVGKLIIHKF